MNEEFQHIYETYKPLLFSLAYRLLGTVSDAEDIVQDVFVKLQGRDLSRIEDRRKYLCKMTTNRCLDLLGSARKKREVYTGPWLPEPLVQDERDPLLQIEEKDTVSYALLVLMEQLNPVERAVFILREAFGYDYADIADIVKKSEVHCRKIFSRAVKKVEPEPGNGKNARLEQKEQAEKTEKLVEQFIHAATTGHMNTFLQYLADDVVLYSDGGGKAAAAVHPLHSREKVAAFISGLTGKYAAASGAMQMRKIRANGQTGLWIRGEEVLPTLVMIDADGEQIRHIYMVRNPDKMRHVPEW